MTEARVKREAAMVPKLIQEMEKFEQVAVKLSKKSEVDLLQYMKKATARDFRINKDQLVKAAQKKEREEEEGEEEEEDDGKRRKKKRKSGGKDGKDGKAKAKASKRAQKGSDDEDEEED